MHKKMKKEILKKIFFSDQDAERTKAKGNANLQPKN